MEYGFSIYLDLRAKLLGFFDLFAIFLQVVSLSRFCTEG